MTVIIYHNPACGTSRYTLALIRNSGTEPEIVEYLKTPPSRDTLLDLTPRALLRKKGTSYAELGLANPALTDDQLVDAMMAHPILINRPLVVTPFGVSSAGRPKWCSTSCPLRSVLPLPRRTASRSWMPTGAA